MPRISEYIRLTTAAREVGIPHNTLVYAVDRGEVHHQTTGDGLRLVLLADVESWARNRPKPGRKPQPNPYTRPKSTGSP